MFWGTIVHKFISSLQLKSKQETNMPSRRYATKKRGISEEKQNTPIDYKQSVEDNHVAATQLSGDETDPVVVFSDDEPDVDDPGSNFSYIVPWSDARHYTLPFGKYKGETLHSMISSKTRRNYLRYIADWKLVRPSTKSNIEAALKHYEHLNTMYQKHKK